jgi:hypothetical protein
MIVIDARESTSQRRVRGETSVLFDTRPGGLIVACLIKFRAEGYGNQGGRLPRPGTARP